METTSKELTTTATEIAASPATDDVLLVASNPEEMQVAQAGLVSWFENKVTALKNDLSDAESNIEIARKGKFKMGPFQSVASKVRRELTYYEKGLAAVREGFCIVPNFPVDIIAIRTNKAEPVGTANVKWGTPAIEQEAGKLPVGDGEYRDPLPTVGVTHIEKNEKNEVTAKWWQAIEFQDVSIPVSFMKPRVLEATQRAMAMKIFDEIGILPDRRKRKSDPVVCGRVIVKRGYETRVMTFLISWFIDTKQL